MLPAWGTYLPLVRQILDWCLAGQARPRNVAVGDTLESSFNGTYPRLPTLTIERPDGIAARVPVNVQGDYRAWSYDDTRISGIYSAQIWPAASRSATFRRKSGNGRKRLDLVSSRRTAKRRPSRRGSRLPDRVASRQRAAGLPEASAGQLHVVLLYAVAGLLLLETVLAWRMGNNRR